MVQTEGGPAGEGSSGRQPDVLCLEVTGGPCRGASHRLEGPQTAFTVGRTKKSRVFIKDSAVSEKHALLSWEGGWWYIEDTGSSNGTSVNGMALREGESCRIFDGCQLRLGTDTEVSVEVYPAHCSQLSLKQVLEAAAQASKRRFEAELMRQANALREQHAAFLLGLAEVEA